MGEWGSTATPAQMIPMAHCGGAVCQIGLSGGLPAPRVSGGNSGHRGGGGRRRRDDGSDKEREVSHPLKAIMVEREQRTVRDAGMTALSAVSSLISLGR
ncbi:hypothetical protein DPEC_G00345880 [Dallia pectoralis]|uniref:Uncharacterized protein n=1 Tax=Dallia pectoralis TaxID=75939 RepID=A0ACC2F3K8_DALPE|nr:hypothetical protein DPEC_G00345880 [Dallia pectoralis]